MFAAKLPQTPVCQRVARQNARGGGIAIALQINQLRLRQGGQGVALTHQRDQCLFQQDFALQGWWHAVGHTGDYKIQLTLGQALVQVHVNGGVKLDLGGRSVHQQAREQGVAHQVCHHVADPNAHAANRPRGELTHLCRRVGQQRCHPKQARVQCVADRCQRHAPCAALEQSCAQPPLQSLQATGQGGLADVQGLGRPRQVAMLGNTQKVDGRSIKHGDAVKLWQHAF